MLFAKKTSELPSPDTALPGRSNPLPTAELHFVNGRPLKGPYPEGLEVADFAMGCFWGVERKFWQVPGVWVTAVGYQNGITPIRPMKRSAAVAPAMLNRFAWSSIPA
ncbi:hypothetical protein ABID41_001076 [Phenylobacterium koreense]|uniref:peptide-methionine (S)-S-oxide reductase n=1 Tax=Phenylobacterium koreense TaxID=266125 RepID=A0ABV2EH88_9CAUL